VPTDVTLLLDACRSPDPATAAEASARLLTLLYDELRQVARWQRRGQSPGLTLSTTGLVHEAFLKVAGRGGLDFESRGHFFGAASQAMRQVLVDAARARGRDKRGGGHRPVPLDLAPEPAADARSDDLLALDEALARLERLDPRAVRVVECRFFAGLSLEETAEALRVSPMTVKRDWRAARAWLARDLGVSLPDPG
jgi:RNA polymerase sigma factor (TIGR02999 family)